MTTAKRIASGLGSTDAETRRRAISLLPEAEGGEVPSLLMRALGDDDWRVRKEAGQVVASMPPDRALIEALVGALEPGDNVGLRNAAVEALAALGSSVVQRVTAALPRLDADGRKLAVEILGRARDASVIAPLDACLSDPDRNVRMAAVEAIGELGTLALDAATGLLSKSLAAPEIEVRLAALEALNRLGIVVPFARLAPLVHEPVLRRAALIAASRSGDVLAADALLEALDAAPNVFVPALVGLAELVIAAEAPVETLRQKVSKAGPAARHRVNAAVVESSVTVEVGRAAMVVGALMGLPQAIDAALEALAEEQTATIAASALRLAGADAVPKVIAQIASGSSARRIAAIQLVSSLPLSDERDVLRLTLRQAVEDPEPAVASAGLAALGVVGGPEDLATLFALSSRPQEIGLSAQGALSVLAARCPDEARAVARLAARGETSPVAMAVVISAVGGGVFADLADDLAFLSASISHPDPRARRTAVDALAHLGAAAGLRAIEYALADEEPEIRHAAVAALGELVAPDGTFVGVSRLLDLVQNPSDDELTVVAMHALGRTDHPRVLDALAPFARSEVPRLAVGAIETIGRLSHPGRVGALTRAMDHPHAEVVKAALMALDGARDPVARSSFGVALEHMAWDVRRLAADCLGRFGGESALELLRARAMVEQEPLVRDAIDRAVLELETPATLRRPATIAPPAEP